MNIIFFTLKYLKTEQFNELIDSGKIYQKTAKTDLRLPQSTEIGKEFLTYVRDGNSIRKEASNIVGNNVVARNPTVLGLGKDGKAIYNEWLIPTDIAIKNYGAEVIGGLSATEFSSHKKQVKLKAIELTPELIKSLGFEGNILLIKVSWSQEPMIAKVGDHITDGGYSTSKNDMKDYEVVTKQQSKLSPFKMK